MSSKRKKTTSSTPLHKYTTREIMELTEQRRQKEDAATKDAEPKAKTPENKPDPLPVEDLNPPLPVPAMDPSPPLAAPIKAISGALLFILFLIAFLILLSSRSSELWVEIVAVKLNALIAYGSFIILSIFQGPCALHGVALNTHYYNISLQGDLVAFYSLELLIVFVALFAYFQRSSWKKSAVVLITMVPLAIMANIFRVVLSFGLALNDGAVHADRYFHGVLVGFVIAFIVLVLVFFEYIFL